MPGGMSCRLPGPGAAGGTGAGDGTEAGGGLGGGAVRDNGGGGGAAEGWEGGTYPPGRKPEVGAAAGVPPWPDADGAGRDSTGGLHDLWGALGRGALAGAGARPWDGPEWPEGRGPDAAGTGLSKDKSWGR